VQNTGTLIRALGKKNLLLARAFDFVGRSAPLCLFLFPFLGFHIERLPSSSIFSAPPNETLSGAPRFLSSFGEKPLKYIVARCCDPLQSASFCLAFRGLSVNSVSDVQDSFVWILFEPQFRLNLTMLETASDHLARIFDESSSHSRRTRRSLQQFLKHLSAIFKSLAAHG
jgi:hypothetical protein